MVKAAIERSEADTHRCTPVLEWGGLGLMFHLPVHVGIIACFCILLCLHRLEAWPEEGTPEAVSGGLFDTGHARTVQLLARLALSTGGDLSANLGPKLAEMMTPERLQVI